MNTITAKEIISLGIVSQSWVSKHFHRCTLGTKISTHIYSIDLILETLTYNIAVYSIKASCSKAEVGYRKARAKNLQLLEAMKGLKNEPK